MPGDPRIAPGSGARAARPRVDRDGPAGRAVCYPAGLFPHCNNAMIETNPIYARIDDLTGRLDALRGYL
jgi:hypothetical protein